MKGFTLVELVIVLIITAILSAVFAPIIIDALKNSQLNACTEQVASHLRHARSVAMAKGQVVGVIFLNPAASNSEYYVKSYDAADTMCSNGTFVQDPLDPSKNLDVRFDDPLRSEFSGVSLASANFPDLLGGTQTVYFNATGVPYPTCPLGSYMLTPGKVVLQSPNGTTVTIYVSDHSGAVVVKGP